MSAGEVPNAVYAQDEYGRPFIIVRDQAKTRIKGLEAQKVSLCLLDSPSLSSVIQKK